MPAGHEGDRIEAEVDGEPGAVEPPRLDQRGEPTGEGRCLGTGVEPQRDHVELDALERGHERVGRDEAEAARRWAGRAH